MIELNDDLLNRYIDGDLDKETISEIKSLLESDPSGMKKYNELLLIHNELRRIPAEETSENFTVLFMNKIQKSIKTKKEQKFFVISILSLFSLICLGIVGYFIANFVLTSESGSGDAVMQLTNQTEEMIRLIAGLFSKGNISILGSVFSFILLVSGYFFYESFRKSKNSG